MQTRDHLYIGGTWVESASSDRLDVISPATEEVIGRVPAATSRTLTARCRPPASPSTTDRGRGYRAGTRPRGAGRISGMQAVFGT